VLKVGIIGAGLNSDYHINFSKKYGDGARIVGVADADPARATACAQKHGLERAFGSAAELLAAGPDVVHVVTPPRTHFDVVREVLEARKHVLIEKPLALNGADAAALYELAERRNVMLCPVHNHLFDPCMRKADALIKSGELGDVINVESYYGLNTNIPAFRDYPRPNVLPWLYNLPGGVYQDFLPHPLYVLLEYTGEPRRLTVMQRSTGVLPQNLPDEIRILVDGERAFGTVTVSFAAKPHLHFIRVYGTKMMVEIDINTMTTVVHPVSSLPKAAQKATYNLDEAAQLTRNTISNMYRFVTGKLKPYHGMMNLIHAYYDAIRTGGQPPVSKQAGLAVVNTMDAVLGQMIVPTLKHERIIPPARALAPGAKKVLVTGGTGFVGKTLVKRLIAEGHAVRVLARKLSNVDGLVALGAEIYWGDVGDLESFDQAFAGCDRVVHLAAGTSGNEKDSETATLQGTRNLLDLATRHNPEKIVYISSCSVYGIADLARNAQVAEDGALERFPERRGTYSASKQQAEALVTAFAKTSRVPVAVLRPGTIYGPGGDLYTPMMGFSMGSTYIVIGMGGFTLPFVHVENVVEAIVQALNRKEAEGEVFNVVDPERLTKRDYMNRVIRRIHPDARVWYMPYSLLYGITWLQELAFGVLRRRPVLTRYRLTSSQRNVIYDCRKLTDRLSWKPKVSLGEALGRLVDSELSKRATPTEPVGRRNSSRAA
jgi:nucleoside-diphosphate-sugar epimerase/predicted dehydrogenase